ncbi:MAG TPA: hypothetical protein VNA69_11400 [Thermoanaerobaculia bacterium]|nr:hypothetical protein [Thermoanaerobaculia bacterium]
MKFETRTLVLVVWCILAISAADAQQHFPALEKGIQPEKLYQFGDIDHINVFNGNLVIALPIGPGYPLDGGLSYQLTLSYNSKVWDEQQGSTGIKALPAKRSNAGLGWVIGMGRFVPHDAPENLSQKALYEAPDGGDHLFEGDRTTDGSNLRLRTVQADVVDIDFPDGMTKRFLKSGGEWNLSAILGPRRAGVTSGLADSVSISRPATRPTQCESDSSSWWVIGDGKQRVHYVCFTNLTVDTVDRPMVDRIVVKGPADAEGVATEAVYSFEYASGVSLAKPTEDTTNNESGWSGIHSVPLLTAINLPDGSKFAFSYFDPPLGRTEPQVRAMTLPAGGQIQYGYTTYGIPAWDLCANTAGNGIGVRSTGIASRTIVPEFNNPNVKHTWRYDTELYRAGANWARYQSNYLCPSGFPDAPPESVAMWDEFIVTIVNPLGGKVKNHFSVWPFGDNDADVMRDTSDAGYEQRNYAYPYGAYDAMQNRYLSQEIFDENGVLKRSVYVRHHRDDPDDHKKGHRLESQRTFYHDGDTPAAGDGSACTKSGSALRCTGSDSTNWDGFGHFRTIANVGNFTAGGDARTVTTTWNMSGGVPRTFSSTAPWILNTYESITAQEQGQTSKSEFCFDFLSGFLKRRRTLKNLDGTWSGRDLVVDLAMSSTTGNLESEAYHGGDAASLPSGSLCGLQLGTPQYKIKHTYVHDSKPVRRSEYDPSPGFLSVDQDLDPSTWLVIKERDSAGVATDVEYDALGRPVLMKPAGRAWTKIEYVAAGTLPASVRVLQYPNGMTAGTPLTSVTHEFDGYGRVVVTKQSMPDNVTSRRETTYDALGRQKTVSELGSAASLPKTTFAYDFAGRVTSATSPDQSVNTFAYTGTRFKSRTSYVAMGSSGTDTATTSYEEYDAYGRLLSVKENSGPAGEQVVTAYTYDVGNRLTTVRMSGTNDTVQNRIFDYDGRGFLRWESQPESGMKTYTYDARGHVVTVAMGAARTMFDLKYAYDAAERLTSISALDPDDLQVYRPMKTFTYGTSNGVNPGDHRLGKLQSATRYNYKPSEFGWPEYVVRVAETYEYKDTAGRRTDRTTSISTSYDGTCCWQEARAIKQSQGYDALGQTSSVSYPMCFDCGAPESLLRNVTSTYAAGRLKSMSDFVSNVSYWPNGMREVLLHSNNMADTQTVHSSGMSRPGSLKFEEYHACHAPTITSQTLAAIRTSSQSSVPLTVEAEGTGPLTYHWYSTDTEALLGTGATYNAAPTTTTDYYVVVTNACRSVRSKTIKVKVGDCVDPWIYDQSVTGNGNGTFTLSVSAYGTGTLSYTWRRESDNAEVGSASTLVTPVLSSSEYYEITVTNACDGAGDTKRLQAYVEPTLPVIALAAERTGPGQITVRWSAVTGATSYELTRNGGAAAGAVELPPTSAIEYIDANLPADKAYVYSLVVKNASGNTIAKSHEDLATTVSFSNLTGAGVLASHYDELLRAVNAMRGYVGWNAVSWGDIIASMDPLPVPGNVILERHLLAIRARLNEALQFGGFAINGYADPSLRGKVIRAHHITEIRERVK